MQILAFTPSIAEWVVIVASLSTPVIMIVMFFVSDYRAHAHIRAHHAMLKAEAALVKAERKQWAATLKAARRARLQ